MMYPKPERPKSKRKERKERYEAVRDLYLREHRFCEAGEVCQHKLEKGTQKWVRARSTEIHHQKGRDGELLLDPEFFLAVCRPCHRWIHRNVALSRERGYILPREKEVQALAEHYGMNVSSDQGASE